MVTGVQTCALPISQYREWMTLKEREERKEQTINQEKQAADRNSYRNETKKKLSYKEKREFELLTNEIERLELEKKNIKAKLCSGTLSVEEITRMSVRLPKLTAEIDEKSMRWLELSEYDS